MAVNPLKIVQMSEVQTLVRNNIKQSLPGLTGKLKKAWLDTVIGFRIGLYPVHGFNEGAAAVSAAKKAAKSEEDGRVFVKKNDSCWKDNLDALTSPYHISDNSFAYVSYLEGFNQVVFKGRPEILDAYEKAFDQAKDYSNIRQDLKPIL